MRTTLMESPPNDFIEGLSLSRLDSRLKHAEMTN